MNNYVVYKHVAPNGKVYIGITRQDVKRRWGKNGERYKCQEKFYNAIQKYGWENIKHIILYKNLNFEDACKKEMELIAKYKSNTKTYGYNVDNGGRCQETFSEETKKKISEARKGKKHTLETRKKISMALKGKKRTEEHRQHLSQSLKGIQTRLGAKLSEETKRKISEAHKEYYKRVNGEVYWKGKHHTQEAKEKIRQSHLGKQNKKLYKKIIQKDIDGKIIKEYESIIQAKDELGIKYSGNIVSCAKGRLKQAYGYVWEYN